MNERITALNISDILAVQQTFPKRVTDSFMRALTETIIEGLQTDGIVKVRGLGTFRIVEVEPRESVSVSTGERIVIPSFKKLSFTAEESITERMSNTADSQADNSDADDVETVQTEIDQTETPDTDEPTTEQPEAAVVAVPEVQEFFSVLNEDREEDTAEALGDEQGESDTQDGSQDIASTVQAENPDTETPDEAIDPSVPVSETPADTFSGIDVLISTPESLEELHDQLTVALLQQQEADHQATAAQTRYDQVQQQLLEAEQGRVLAQQKAEQAAAEVKHIEQLIQNVETNRITQLAENNASPIDTPAEDAAPTQEDTELTVSSTSAPVADIPVQTDQTQKPDDEVEREDDEEEEERTPWWRIPLILLILLLVGGACYFIAVNPQLPFQWLNDEPKEEEVPVTVEALTPETQPAGTPQPAKGEPSTQPTPSKADTPAATPSPADQPQPTAEHPQSASKPQQPSEKPKQQEASKPQRPKTHTVRRGESLTKISLQYYGTKDSVRAIIRANNFRDPNNINEGAVVKLP